MAAYFNSAVFKRNMTRFWPLAAVCFLSAFIVFVIPETASSQNYPAAYDSHGNIIGVAEKDIMSALAAYCSVFVPIVSIFTAIALFGYLHNSKAAGFVSSLPITRTGLYITNLLSGLTLMLVPTLLVGALYGFLLLGQPVPSGDFLRWIGALIASHLIFFPMAVFFTFLTGNPVMQAFLYVASNIVFYAFYLTGTFIAHMFVFGYSDLVDSPVLALATSLSPPVAILHMIQFMIPNRTFWYGYETYMPTAALPWALYLAFAALMTFIGCLLYRRRRIEVAGEIIVHRPVKSIFKYLMGLLAGVVMAVLVMLITSVGGVVPMTEWTVRFTVSTMVFGALGCLLAEMLIRKRLRVLKTAYKGMIVFVAAIAAVMLFIRFDGIGYERRVPDPNEVASVSFRTNTNFILPLHRPGAALHPWEWHAIGLPYPYPYRDRLETHRITVLDNDVLHEIKLRIPEYFESPEAIAAATRLHRAIVDDKRSLEEHREDWGFHALFLTYTMKDGSIMTRQYGLPVGVKPTHELVELLLELYNQPEAVDKRNRFVDLPDSSILGAVVTPVTESFWLANDPYWSRLDFDSTFIAKDDLSAITKALRQDAEAGTLGRLRHSDLRQTLFFQDANAARFVIDLVLDSGAAGVPATFEPDNIPDEDYNFVTGLVLSIIINEEHVNTMRVLNELGALQN